jgi:HlyD family secretion protein
VTSHPARNDNRSEAGAPSGQAMDRILAPRSPWPRRVLLAIAALAGASALLFFRHRAAEPSLIVEGSQITLGRVTRGEFDDFIQVRGPLEPLETVFVDTASGGQVEAIRVEDGARVEKGQLLLELSNSQLQLDHISREAEITEQLNNLRGLELAQEQNRLVHERETVEVEYQIRRLTRQIGRAQQLVDEGLAARSDLDDMSDELSYHQQRQKVQADTWAAAERLQKQQVVQQRAASRQLERNLAIARENLASLDVVAPASGQLSGFNLEVGQSLAPGERMAQIDDPDHFKVVADIDEFYLSRVTTGQKAEMPLGGSSYALQVSKIRPQVQDGRFQVDLVFTGRTPPDVRRGQSAEVRLELGQPSPALLIPNAAFYNDTGGAWVFVVSSDHRRATRRVVRLGRRNPRSIEVLDGLTDGEEIVTSPYTNFLDTPRLDLTR